MDKYYLLTRAIIVSVILFFAYTNITTLTFFFDFFTFKNIAYGEIAMLPKIQNLSNLDTQITKKSNISFVGDVMLARHVEYLMIKNGREYPYKSLNFSDKEETFYVGNFEGSIPIEHKKTPNFNFNFSVSEIYLEPLKNIGFSHFSLANNHALDFGREGLENSKSTLSSVGLVSFGNPSAISTSSVEFIDLEKIKVALIAVNAIGSSVTSDQINEILTFADNNSDFQVVYIHWGNEYELSQSEHQRKLATKFVKAGTDLILGHHPHVTQGIEKIDDALVFYSLGNFIFDQYFSNDVREGLMVTLFTNNGINLSISGITSNHSLAQPKLMTEYEQDVFIESLADRSSKELRDEIISKRFTLNIPLATSSESVIMAE